jgi:hypothetical protein
MGEYTLCTEINGECRCQQVGARPCSAIVEMCEEGLTAADEQDRMEAAREEAGVEEC